MKKTEERIQRLKDVFKKVVDLSITNLSNDDIKTTFSEMDSKFANDLQSVIVNTMGTLQFDLEHHFESCLQKYKILEYFDKVDNINNNIDEVDPIYEEMNNSFHSLILEEINQLKQYIIDLNIRCEELQKDSSVIIEKINNSRNDLCIENKMIQDSEIKLNEILQIE